MYQIKFNEHALAQLQVKGCRGSSSRSTCGLLISARQRNPLFLAATNHIRALVCLVLHLNQRQHPVNLGINLLPRLLSDAQAEGDIFTNSQMGKRA